MPCRAHVGRCTIPPSVCGGGEGGAGDALQGTRRPLHKPAQCVCVCGGGALWNDRTSHTESSSWLDYKAAQHYHVSAFRVCSTQSCVCVMVAGSLGACICLLPRLLLHCPGGVAFSAFSI
jgi:hypothetical protein